jgi:hypothetical protein
MIPVEHCPSTLMMPPEAEAELGRYKIALSKYFEKQGKTAVYFEWVSPRSHHANLQVWMLHTCYEIYNCAETLP